MALMRSSPINLGAGSAVTGRCALFVAFGRRSSSILGDGRRLKKRNTKIAPLRKRVGILAFLAGIESLL